jgi:hypothetical protein
VGSTTRASRSRSNRQTPLLSLWRSHAVARETTREGLPYSTSRPAFWSSCYLQGRRRRVAMTVSWTSPCNYEGCGKHASIIEKGNPRCRRHTAERVKVLLAEKAKQERILKAEVQRKRDIADYAKGLEKALRQARSGAKSSSFVGISGRKRAFNLCSRCGAKTESGLSERDPALRFCTPHMPSTVAIQRAELSVGYAKASLCVSNGRARECRGHIRLSGQVCETLPRKCLLTTHQCFDASRKWAIVRIRCRTKFPKNPALAPRPEARAASP